MNTLNYSPENSTTPNYTARRLAVGAGAVIMALGAVTGFNHVTHRETVAETTTNIPSDVDVSAGRFEGEITVEAVCDATEQLVDTASLPPGISNYEKNLLKDSCDNAAHNLIEKYGPVVGKKAVISLEEDWMLNYSVSADILDSKS